VKQCVDYRGCVVIDERLRPVIEAAVPAVFLWRGQQKGRMPEYGDKHRWRPGTIRLAGRWMSARSCVLDMAACGSRSPTRSSGRSETGLQALAKPGRWDAGSATASSATHERPVARGAWMTEPLLDKRGCARHFAVSVRTVEAWLAAGCPHVRLAGRSKLRASEVERWLAASGRLERRGELASTGDPA
jgi:hypothetical protein